MTCYMVKNDLINTDFLIFFSLTAVVGGGETFLEGGEKGKQGQEQFKNQKKGKNVNLIQCMVYNAAMSNLKTSKHSAVQDAP